MKTTTVQSSELGDDWTARAHMVRVLTEAQNVQPGDKVRVRDHRGTDESGRRWHTVTVQAVGKTRVDSTLTVDKWPIAYVCPQNELVELVEIRRTVTFRCVNCNRTDARDKQTRTVTLKDFVDTELMKAGGLHLVILPDTEPREQTGYCREHALNYLS